MRCRIIKLLSGRTERQQKEGSVNIYVQTAKDAAVMAPDAIADGVVSELRIFAAELAGSGTNSLSSD